MKKQFKHLMSVTAMDLAFVLLFMFILQLHISTGNRTLKINLPSSASSDTLASFSEDNFRIDIDCNNTVQWIAPGLEERIYQAANDYVRDEKEIRSLTERYADGVTRLVDSDDISVSVYADEKAHYGLVATVFETLIREEKTRPILVYKHADN